MGNPRYRLAKLACLALALLLSSCGGGGSSDNQPATSMTWDDGNWNEVNWQ